MTTIWNRNYMELAETRPYMYSASIYETEYEGVGKFYTFNAYPNRGDVCEEYRSKDRDDIIAKAEEWFLGSTPVGFCSASF